MADKVWLTRFGRQSGAVKSVADKIWPTNLADKVWPTKWGRQGLADKVYRWAVGRALWRHNLSVGRPCGLRLTPPRLYVVLCANELVTISIDCVTQFSQCIITQIMD